MPFFSRPLDFGSIDRFDDGTGRFSLPLQYHHLFFFVINLPRRLRAKRITDADGRVRIRVDPYMVQLLGQHATDLMAHIAAASYGGVLPDDTPITSLRAGSLEELGLLPPAILRLFLYVNGINPLAQQDLSVEFFDQWTNAFQLVAIETREWLTVAQRRTILLGESCGWNWKAPTSFPGLRRVTEEGTDTYSPLRPYFSTDFRSGAGRPRSTLVLRSPPSPCTISSSGEPGGEPPVTKTSTDLIPHPIYGPGAQNALVPYHGRVPATSTSTDLIPHPVYGPGAQNALVPYRPSTPWTGDRDFGGLVAPPNTINEEFEGDSDSSSETGSDVSSYATACMGSNTVEDEDMYYDVVDVGVQTDPIDSDDSELDDSDDSSFDDSDSDGSMPSLEYMGDPHEIIDLTLDDD